MYRADVTVNNNQYNVYMDEVFQLAKTLVIKFDKTIELINEYTNLLHPNTQDMYDKTTWKYYRHVAGLKHPSDPDITVTSLDTLEPIEFTIENLKVHRATRKAYGVGTRYFNELLSRFPDHRTYILGVLYPVDIHAAINARDGQIIGYPKELVQNNEYTLISELQKWIDGYLFRWVNKAFYVAHDMYYLTWQSVFYALLPQVIVSLRHARCRTNEVHSFHVWMYLSSHGQLDRYQNQLTLRQALWLYRNVLHVKKNLGQIDTFNFLTDAIMTARQIPLSGYEAQHNLLQVELYEKSPQNIADPKERELLYPIIEFKRNTINGIRSVEVLDPIELKQLLIKEDGNARANYEVRQTDEPMILEKMENTLSNNVKTKALESTLFDYTGSNPYSLETILLNHWIYLSSKGLYTAYIAVENPKTGDIFNLSAKDAFVFSYYFFCRSIGLDLIEVPRFLASRVQRIPSVTAEHIYEVADKSIVPFQLAFDILEKQPVIGPITSIESFSEICAQIASVAEYQRGIMSLQEHYLRRGFVHAMVSRVYADVLCPMTDTVQDYESWFIDKGIDINDFDLVNPGQMWDTVSTTMMGITVNKTNSLSSIQKAMTRIMEQLSSYSIQFINEINNAPLRVIEPLTVRPGEAGAIQKLDVTLDHMAADVLGYASKQSDNLEYDVRIPGLDELNAKLDGALQVNGSVNAGRSDRALSRIIYVDAGVLSTRFANELGTYPQQTSMLGLESFLLASPEYIDKLHTHLTQCD